MPAIDVGLGDVVRGFLILIDALDEWLPRLLVFYSVLLSTFAFIFIAAEHGDIPADDARTLGAIFEFIFVLSLVWFILPFFRLWLNQIKEVDDAGE